MHRPQGYCLVYNQKCKDPDDFLYLTYFLYVQTQNQVIKQGICFPKRKHFTASGKKYSGEHLVLP